MEKMRGEEEMEKIRCGEKTERGGGGVEIEDFIAWEDEVVGRAMRGIFSPVVIINRDYRSIFSPDW